MSTMANGQYKHLDQNLRTHKKSASWVSLKWVKSNECRRRRKKVSVNNGQYKRLDQFGYNWNSSNMNQGDKVVLY